MKVLVIDDSQTQADLLSRILKKIEGVEPVKALDAFEGYTLLRVMPDIKAVILDFNMPYANGISLVKKLRDTPEFKKLPVAFSSSEDNTEDYMAAGANQCFIKPYNLNSLAEFIDNCR